MKRILLFLAVMFCLSTLSFAVKDTVNVPGFYESGGVAPDNYGTLNDAIDLARTNGTINNTVFKLTPFDVYVLSRSIFMSFGENLEIVAPKPGDAKESAPPQIVWTEEDIDQAYIIQTYGDVILKNIRVRYDDFSGVQQGTSITFEDSLAIQGEDKERGEFYGCIFDYSGIGSDGAGTITVKADHFTGIFEDCYFRNLSDPHFQYYGRAVSFPYQSSGWHYDSLFFENCSFSNIGRIVMQEGNEFGSNVQINHCTMLNSIEWVYQTQGWSKTVSITNSIFINPYMMGYRGIDLCDSLQTFDDFQNGLCNPPGGGLINGITAVDSFGFTQFVDFTDYDRKIFIGNNVYMYQSWMQDWYVNSPWAKDLHKNRHDLEIRHPSPMLGENEIAFIDSMDNGQKVFKTMNVDWSTIYDTDPDFIVPPTNEDTLKLFIEGKWGTGVDIDWAYRPDVTFGQVWPLPDDMAYNNADYQTAAMGGFPLGDMNWWPDKKAAWEAQRDNEWANINNWLDNGEPTGVTEIPGTMPRNYVLEQNYPNPFNPTTNITYSVPQSGQISLKVFNTLGQEVATIFNGYQAAGNYAAIFDGSKLTSGVYFYRLQSDNVLSQRNLF